MTSLFSPKEIPIYLLSKDKVKLPVVIKPQAQQSKILGVINGRLKVAINATPVDGQANKVLITFFADIFAVKKQQIIILNGLTNRLKLLELPISVTRKLDEIIAEFIYE